MIKESQLDKQIRLNNKRASRCRWCMAHKDSDCENNCGIGPAEEWHWYLHNDPLIRLPIISTDEERVEGEFYDFEIKRAE